MRRSSLAAFALLLLALPATPRADAPQTEIDYEAADPSAPPVTAANLAAHERFWPFHVALTEDWAPPGAAQAISRGVRGVLIRIEPKGRARVDFGRDGVRLVPVAKTDLVEAANRIREGRIHKAAPNYVLAVSSRLTTPGAPGRVGPTKAVEHAGFVNVFVDPASDAFEPMAKAFAPLDGRHGTKTVLYPQGGPRPGLNTAERLTALGWGGYLVDDVFSPAYSEAQLEGEPPAVVVVTPDGRVAFQSAWGPDVAERVARALDSAFGAGRTAAAQP